MPLEILALLVVFGVGGIVLAVHLTGGTVTAHIDRPEAAIERFGIDFPDIGVIDVAVTTDGETAFLALDDGAVGLVHSVGDQYLTRYIDDHQDVIVQVPSETTLSLKLDDFTWRGGEFGFSSAAEKSKAARMFGPDAGRGETDG